MPLDLTTNQLIEKNKISSVNVELLLLEFIKENEPPARFCLNNELITWNTYDWYPAQFTLDGLLQSKDAEISRPSLTFFDNLNIFIPIIEKYNGANGTAVNVYIVDSIYLNNAIPKDSYSMEILTSSVGSKRQVSITLGSENLIDIAFPQDSYQKNSCRYNYLFDSRCGYSGSVLTCKRTYADCVAHENQLRYGGFLGVGAPGYMV